MNAKAWLDRDGVSVWWAHDCDRARMVALLPSTTKAGADGKVRPPVSCHVCGFGATLLQVEAAA